MVKYIDVVVALLILMIVLIMILPIPTFLLDVLQILDLSLSLIIILTTMYIRETLDISSFPSILLIMTLFRLSLNVTSTRLILLQGKNFSGKVIRTFGMFVVSGNYVVGLIIFLILIIIQYIVITRGAERIAEVAARFTLDAMPGKQMSVDADYNAGIITEQEARNRRMMIRREADFYGAMDGASKFVRGDAIASIIIVFINILGGLIIGVMMQHLSFSDAAKTYTLLTVGDGLVTQIPALLVSTATGFVVSRAASESNLGRDVTEQLSSQPRALILTGISILFLGIFTPIPVVSSSLIGIATIFLALSIQRRRRLAEAPAGPEKAGGPPTPAAPMISTPEEVSDIIQTDIFEVEIGYGLIPLADPQQGGDLLDRITMIRRQIALELGLVVSPIRVRDSMLLKPNEYVFKLKGAEVARYELMVDRFLAMNPGTVTKKVEGIPTKEPAFGLEALWITEEDREAAELAGYTVVDPPSVFATHLTEVIKRYSYEFLGRNETEMLINGLKEKYESLVNEVIPDILKIPDVQKILQNLLKEAIPIRNLPTIFEVLADYGRKTTDLDLLTEKIRQKMKRLITNMYKSDDGKLHVITLDPALEKQLTDAITGEEEQRFLNINPEVAQKLIDNISKSVEETIRGGYQPVLLCSSSLRRYLRRLTEKPLYMVPIMSYAEVAEEVEVVTSSVVSL